MNKKIALLLSLTMTLSSVTFAGNEVIARKQIKTSPYLKAATEGSISNFKKLLIKNANLNEKDTSGNTALMLTIANDHIDLAKLLIEKKVDINLKNNDGNTALYIALVNDHAEIAEALIKKGANLDAINSEEDSALSIAATTNTHKIMNLVLSKKSSLINQPNKNGVTPLMEAARFGSGETISILLKAGADKSARNAEGKTSLEIATKAQNTEGVKLLQK